MSPVDRFDTPDDLADEISGFVEGTPTSVADVCAGSGQLLRSVSRRFPDAKLYASDIDPAVVSQLRAAHPAWKLGRVDFLNARSRSASPVFRDREFDAIVLNPPFSQRGGGTRFGFQSDQVEIPCSKAIAFLLTARRYLAPNGELIAVLPSGVLTNARDERAVEILKADGLALLSEWPRGTFSGCTADLTLVRVSAGSGPSVSSQAIPQPANHPDLLRGTLGMHQREPDESGLLLVHTTKLRDGALLCDERVQDPGRSVAQGPAVFVPRVGRPDAGKIVVAPEGDFVLSDCVFAIGRRSSREAEELRTALLENWNTFVGAFKGSCAPHITKLDLSRILFAVDKTPLPRT